MGAGFPAVSQAHAASRAVERALQSESIGLLSRMRIRLLKRVTDANRAA